MAGLLPTVELMQPVLTGRPFHREAWVYEEKVDSWRVVAYKDADRVRLVNRNGGDLTRRFPELAAVVGVLPARTLILDGEVEVFDIVWCRVSSGCAASEGTRGWSRRTRPDPTSAGAR